MLSPGAKVTTAFFQPNIFIKKGRNNIVNNLQQIESAKAKAMELMKEENLSAAVGVKYSGREKENTHVNMDKRKGLLRLSAGDRLNTKKSLLGRIIDLLLL